MNLSFLILLAASLPTFGDFQRIDRERRTTGQFQTSSLLDATRVDPLLVAATVSQQVEDAEIAWGAAELSADWRRQKAMFESALRIGGTNVAVALRLACAAARHSEFDLATRWIRYSESKDPGNTAPWLVELWILHQQQLPEKLAHPPSKPPGEFRDYSLDATRARIRVLEAAGYSSYSARRLGISADSALLTMIRDLCQAPVSEAASSLLGPAATAMQRHPPFILTELVGESTERSLLALRKDAATNLEIQSRVEQMNTRREELKELIAGVEHNIIDLASESQMVSYFDDVVLLGEEPAMKRLAVEVRHQLLP